MSSGKRLKVNIVGAGMAGLLAAIRLLERGDEVIVLEKGNEIGGTWRDNRYLGLTCDVPDLCIGQLLGRCQPGKDGIWPHEAVRIAIENVGTEQISRGMELAV